MTIIRLLLLGFCLTFLQCGDPQHRATAEQPNILFIAVDDLNDWVGFLNGHSGMKIHTPNLGRG